MKLWNLPLLALLLAPVTALAADLHRIELAFRDASATHESERRAVKVQGLRDRTFLFATACGATGAQCECLFYRGENDAQPLRSASLGISAQNNSLTCTIPGDFATPDRIRFVAVRTRAGQAITERAEIKGALTLEDVIGRLPKSKVRGVFRYNCRRTFFEGEGVSESQISCVGGQHLGVITAAYSFYTYRSGEDRNDPAGDSAFPSDICQRNNVLRFQCTGSVPELRFGLYKEPVGPFNVAIQLTRAPEGEFLTDTYGYAALPDSAGRCPIGLVKIRPWMAQPASITEGSLDGTNPPSSFLNSNNQLSNVVVEMSQPANFTVARQPNQVPCAATGDCSTAEFGGATVVQSVAYTPITPVVCAIPKELLTGLF